MGLVRTIQSLHGAGVSVLDRSSSLLVLVASFLTGAVLGIVARIWMRFITTNPEFGWAGTLIIVVGFGVMFLGQAGVYLGRRSGLRQSGFVALRVLAIVTLVPLATGAGAVAFLVIVIAPLAIIRTGWNRWLRLLLGVFASLSGIFVAFTLFSDLSAIRASFGLVWFALVYGILVWAVSFSFASRDDPQFTHVAHDPRRHEGAPAPVNRPGVRALSVMCDRSVDRHGFWHGIRFRVRRAACGRVDA
jgi:type IV secretory pathway TrbD component